MQKDFSLVDREKESEKELEREREERGREASHYLLTETKHRRNSIMTNKPLLATVFFTVAAVAAFRLLLLCTQTLIT